MSDDALRRDLYILEDENNPTSSKANNIWPSTILDQVYDQLAPNKKTLRTILEELHQDIISGGAGNIVFPVTSVNGMEGDISITKDHLGLDNVDNTSDLEKPLSDPQRAAIMNILEHFEFQVDMSDVHEHILDSNNPHGVTLEQLDQDDEVKNFVIRLIEVHNVKDDAHADIRSNMEFLMDTTNRLDTDLNARMDAALDAIDAHSFSAAAHNTLFEAKEDHRNKASTFDTVDHVKFPTVRAVVDYVSSKLDDFRDILNAEATALLDIVVANSRSDLPRASESVSRKIYFIQSGVSGCNEIAVCRLANGAYSWDISSIDILPKLNQSQFQRDPNGISLNIGNVSQGIIGDSNISSYLVDSVRDNIPEIMTDYYTKAEVEAMGIVHSIRIIRGTNDGTIRYYINDDMDTMSDDVYVAGLASLAFLDKVTTEHIEDEVIEGRHIKNHTITGASIADRTVESRCLTAEYNTILGNMDDSTGRVEEIPVERLAEILRPYIDISEEIKEEHELTVSTVDGAYLYYNTLKIGQAWDSTKVITSDGSRYTENLINVSPYIGYKLIITADTIGTSSSRAFGFADNTETGIVISKYSERMMEYNELVQKYTIEVPIDGPRFFFSSSSRMTGLEIKAVKKITKKTQADTVYVSKTGDDTGYGTLSSPFRTIQRAVDSEAGIILVFACTEENDAYEPFQIINRSTPIKIMLADYPETPTSGSYYPEVLPHIVVSDKTVTHDYQYAINIKNCSDVYISDLEGCNVRDHIFNIEDTSKIEMVRCIAHDNNSTGATTHEKSGFRMKNVNGVFRDCEAYNVTLDGFGIHGNGDTQFINCVAHDCDDDGISHHDRCTGIVHGGEYYRCGKGGIATPTYGAKVTIENVYSHHNKFGAYIVGSNQASANHDPYGINVARCINCVFINNNIDDNGGRDILVSYTDITMTNVVYRTRRLAAGVILKEYSSGYDLSDLTVGNASEIPQNVGEWNTAGGDSIAVGMTVLVEADENNGGLRRKYTVTAIYHHNLTVGNASEIPQNVGEWNTAAINEWKTKTAANVEEWNIPSVGATVLVENNGGLRRKYTVTAINAETGAITYDEGVEWPSTNDKSSNRILRYSAINM